jgi:hypothetical protein
MPYSRKWSLLGDAVRLVIASGLSRSEAKRDICAALVDRRIRLNPTPPADLIYPIYLFKNVRAPPDLTPRDIDWAHSRPKNPWPGYFGRGPLLPIAKLEVLTENVVEVLCEGDSLAVMIRALASHLKKNPKATRAEAKTWCGEQGYEFTDRVFQFRVWPRARKQGGLTENAPAGRKANSSHAGNTRRGPSKGTS